MSVYCKIDIVNHVNGGQMFVDFVGHSFPQMFIPINMYLLLKNISKPLYEYYLDCID
jgi:hypothetical protein